VTDPELQALIDQIHRDDARLTGRVILAIGIALAAMFFASCSSHRAPDLRAAPPARIEARLKVYPEIGIAGQRFTLLAELVDPRAEVICPSITWTWPNGTRSGHTEDCDPETREVLHSDVQRGALPAGEHHFRVAFGFEGREWKAEKTVPVQ
jgi:hypothetical protein